MEAHEEVENFKNLYGSLSKKQQKIWRYLHWFCRSYRTVKPSHAHIAKQCECSRDTVIQALKKFVNYGWLGMMKKFWRTTTYFISEALLRVNPSDSNSFRRKDPIPLDKKENPTHGPTLNPTHITNTSSETLNVGVQSSKDNLKTQENSQETREISHQLKDVPIPEEDKRLLSRFSERVLALSIEDCRSYNKKYRIRNLPALLTHRCKHYIQRLTGSKPLGRMKPIGA